MDRELIEGIDYYMEGGFIVFTAQYLRDRGYCCTSGCRHCPYGYERELLAPTSVEPKTRSEE